MRAHYRLSAAGFGAWIPLNPKSQYFGVALSVKLSPTVNLTYSVQHTLDEIYTRTQEFSISRAGTTATVTKTGHGLSTGGWAQFTACGAPFDGEYSITVVDNNSFTVTVVDTGPTALAQGAGYIQTAAVFPHATLAALTASADGNYAYPPRATRLVISSYTSGTADFSVIQVGN